MHEVIYSIVGPAGTMGLVWKGNVDRNCLIQKGTIRRNIQCRIHNCVEGVGIRQET